nr:hypothetical protein [Nocardia transvalensis]
MPSTDMRVSDPASNVLASLSAEEIDIVRTAVEAAGLLAETTRFVYVGLAEPDKQAVLAYQEGAAGAPERMARALLLDTATGAGGDLLVSISRAVMLERSTIDAELGQVPVLVEEFAKIGEIMAGNERWCAALRAHGVDPAMVAYVPLSAGHFDISNERGRRVIRVLAFRQDHPQDHPWAHPIDGLSAYVDMTFGELIDIIDHRVFDVPAEPGNFQDPPRWGRRWKVCARSRSPSPTGRVSESTVSGSSGRTGG